MDKKSWINQLVKEYKKLGLYKLDKGNEIILNCLSTLKRLNKSPTLKSFEKEIKSFK